MKKMWLPVLWTFLFIHLFFPLHAASSGHRASATSTVVMSHAQKSSKELRSQSRRERRAGKWSQRIQKKVQKLKARGKLDGSFNLGILGLMVMLIGGLFIVLGLVIPAIGILFLVIGIIIAFVGLLLLLLLSNVRIDAD